MTKDYSYTELDLSADTIDVREIIARFEELEDRTTDSEDAAELETLSLLLDELKGQGGDEQWRGDWYPVTLIRDSYFEQHARDLAEDIGAVNKNNQWPNYCIDWEYASRELKYDYSSTTIDNVTYWFR